MVVATTPVAQWSSDMNVTVDLECASVLSGSVWRCAVYIVRVFINPIIMEVFPVSVSLA